LNRILIVEDEAHLANGLRFNLEAEGYEADVVADGEAAVEKILRRGEKFDAIVLDVMLPGISGFTVVGKLREARSYVPVLMLTARGRPEDVLEGFAAGTDDYLPKPFDLPIFLARLQSLLRRSAWLRNAASGAPNATATSPATTEKTPVEGEPVIRLGKHEIDFDALELRGGGETVRLTLMEAKLLRHLIRSMGRPVSRKSILEDVWGLHEDTDTRAIDNFVVRLRRYLEDDPANPKHLLTVRGVGYRFVE
jgi:two-component system, OmpR family, alkaline phosphatase synthesis response regulator PhoP